jgi:hypothetical protein
VQSGCLLSVSAPKDINLKSASLGLGAVWHGVFIESLRPDVCAFYGWADSKPSSKGLSIRTMGCVFWDLAGGTKDDKLVALLDPVKRYWRTIVGSKQSREKSQNPTQRFVQICILCDCQVEGQRGVFIGD